MPLLRPNLARLLGLVSLLPTAAIFAEPDDATQPITPYVVGGKDTTDDAYPWMVALLRDDSAQSYKNNQFCGGILIDPEWVLTAAHCVDEIGPADFIIGYGDSNLDVLTRTVQPTFVIPHPAHYFRSNRGADLALIQLAEPITDIEPIKLNQDSEYARALTQARIIGWGGDTYDYDLAEYPAQLQEADIDVHTLDYVNDPDRLNASGHRDYIPAGTESPQTGAFAGDSGGPLLARDESGDWKAIGITSHGYGACGGPFDHLTFFTDIAMFEEWIHTCISLKPWQPSEIDIADGLKAKPIIGLDPESGEPQLYSRVWPFSDQFQPNRYFAYQDSRTTLAWEWASDYYEPLDKLTLIEGQWYWRQPFNSIYPFANPSSFQKIAYEERSPRSVRFFELRPYGSILVNRNVDAWYEPSMHMDVIFNNIQANVPYRYRVSNGSHSIYQHKNAQRANLDRIDNSFDGQDRVSYLLRVLPNGGRDVSIVLVSGTPENIGISNTLSGRLSTDSAPHRKPGFYTDSFELNEWIDEEATITVTSNFDAEIQLHHREDYHRIGYYDSARLGTETMIVGGNSLSEAEISLTNFTENDLGTYTIRIDRHSNSRSVSVHTSTQRAITANDKQYHFDDGVTQYYETMSLANLQSGRRTYISVRGNNGFKASFAVFDRSSGDLIESVVPSRCSSVTQLSFIPAAGRQYDLDVAVFDEHDLNGNYELTIGTTSRTSSETQNLSPKPMVRYSKPHARRISSSDAIDRMVESHVMTFPNE